MKRAAIIPAHDTPEGAPLWAYVLAQWGFRRLARVGASAPIVTESLTVPALRPSAPTPKHPKPSILIPRFDKPHSAMTLIVLWWANERSFGMLASPPEPEALLGDYRRWARAAIRAALDGSGNIRLLDWAATRNAASQLRRVDCAPLQANDLARVLRLPRNQERAVA